jgi:site-specific DNA recombinase
MASLVAKTDGQARAAGYTRVSTTEQAEEGFSLDAQEEKLRQFIASQKLVCGRIYIERGISGRRADTRPELQQMLADADARKFDMLVIPSLDRLGRNARDLYEIMARLEAAGVAIKSLRGDVDTSSATGRLITGLMANVAEFESNLIGERTAAGKAASVASGRRNGGPRPFGYDQGDKVLTPRPHEFEVLRECRDRYVTGEESLAEICRDLNRRGIRTARGAKWSQSRLSQMFGNPLYVGRVRHYDNEYVGAHEPVFSQAEWDELQAMLASKRRRTGRGLGRSPKLHLFPGGVIRCSRCESAIIPRRTSNAQGRVYELYVCGGKLQGSAPDCTMPSIRREALDGAVFDYFENVALDVEGTRRRFARQIAGALAETREALAAAEHQHAQAEGRLARVRRAFQDDEITATDWREQRDELQAEEKAAAAEADHLRRRVEQIEAEGARLDAAEEVLRYLTDLRAAIAERVSDAASIGAVRAALLRVMDGFTLHSFAEPVPETTAEPPAGWVRSRSYVQPELLIAGNGGFLLEPHPRREAILDPEKEIAFPELRRVALDARVRTSASGR